MHRCSGRRRLSSQVFQLEVELGTQQQRKAHDPEPAQGDRDCRERTVKQGKTSEMAGIVSERHGQAAGSRNRDHRARPDSAAHAGADDRDTKEARQQRGRDQQHQAEQDEVAGVIQERKIPASE